MKCPPPPPTTLPLPVCSSFVLRTVEEEEEDDDDGDGDEGGGAGALREGAGNRNGSTFTVFFCCIEGRCTGRPAGCVPMKTVWLCMHTDV